MRLKGLLSPPKTTFDSLIEIGKFNLMWNVSVILIPVFTILLLLHIALGDISWTTSLAALLVAIFNLFVLKRYQNYVIVGWFSVILGMLICQLSIFVVEDSRLLADAMWCLLTAFFTFFLFGNFFGTIVLLVNLSGLIGYQFFVLPEKLMERGVELEHVDARMVINVYYVAFALAFVISRMQKSNEEISRRFEEQIEHNEVLFKEVHHRVKNNLQIMASLLRLQAAENQNPEVVNSLMEAVGRINSMAFIHERMYQKENLIDLDLKVYFKEFCQAAIAQMDNSENVRIKVEGDPVNANPDAIVSLSLLINELLTNSVKHGFEGGIGSISIDLERRNDVLCLRFSDNGTWKVPIKDNSFGKELINTLTEQLEGTVKRSSDPSGTSYMFCFPLRNISIRELL